MLMNLGVGGGGRGLLNASRSPERQVCAIVIAHPVDANDPLETIDVSEALARAGGWPSLPVADAGHGTSSGGIETSSPGLAWAAHVGRASSSLVASAVLIALFFRRRMLAIAITSFFVVVLAVALDRWMVDVHVSRLLDEDRPLDVRCVAAAELRSSFFFRDSARQAARRVADDEATPRALRLCALGSVHELDDAPF